MEVFHFYTTRVSPCISPYMNVNPRIPFGTNGTHHVSPQNFRLKFCTREAARTTTLSSDGGPSHGVPHEYTEQLRILIDGFIVTMHKDHLLSGNGADIRDNGLPTNRNSRPALLSIILSGLGVPNNFQEGCINKIHNTAVSMLQNPTYSNLHILMMEVTLTRVKHSVERPGTTQIINTDIYFEEDVNDELLMEPEEDEALHQIGTTCRASESSIEALENVSMDTARLMNDECVICLEDLGNGMEVRKLPCSHIYHGDCIKPWLARSIFCPICRFAMPCVHQAGSAH